MLPQSTQPCFPTRRGGVSPPSSSILHLLSSILALLLITSLTHAQTLPTYDLTPTKSYTDRSRAWDEQHLISALQGLANRTGPNLYLFYTGDNGATDQFWLDYLRSPNQWLSKHTLDPIPDLPTLLTRFSHTYKGLVLYSDTDPASSLAASTAAGCDDLLPLRFDPSPTSLYTQLVTDPKGPRLPIKLDLRNLPPGPTNSRKCDTTLWSVTHYTLTGKADPTHLAHFPNSFGLTSNRAPLDRTLLVNHDYFISHKSLFFDLHVWDDESPDDDRAQKPGTDLQTLLTLLHATHSRLPKDAMIHVGGFTPWDQKYTTHTGLKHDGVPTEWRLAEILSCFDAYLDADAPGLNTMANASLFQHFPLQKNYPQPTTPTKASLRAKGYLTDNDKVVPHNYYTFYVGDYDSAAWLYQQLPEKWTDKTRGQIPLGWAFNPSLEKRFPVGLHFARTTATPNDSFITGDSGYGYLNPGYLVPPRKWSSPTRGTGLQPLLPLPNTNPLPSGLSRWQQLCTPAYSHWDLSITGFIIDGYAPPMSPDIKRVYTTFSPTGVVAQKINPIEYHHSTPFLRMNADLANPKQGAQQISQAFPDRTPTQPHFQIFRTILWTPTQHKTLSDSLQKSRPDIHLISPHELFLLLSLNQP